MCDIFVDMVKCRSNEEGGFIVVWSWYGRWGCLVGGVVGYLEDGSGEIWGVGGVYWFLL